jgi:tetratricopeptide (TPR) repeat protein
MARRLSIIHREHLLLAGLVVVIAAFFSLTTFAAHAYHRKQEQFGERWYRRGEAALQRGRPSEAVADFRNALAYSRDNDRYRLRLAQALMADHRPDEARSHLLSLWEKEPGDGLLNLQLARLAVMWGDTAQAVRYYHAAIYGLWPDEPMAQRWQIRFELSEYLLRRNTVQSAKDAQAEVVALVAELPPQDPAGQTRLGSLLLEAGLYARALAAFRNALTDQPNLMPALEGAGEAAFHMGDYQTARHYLLPVVAQKSKDAHALELLDLSELVLKLDPAQHGLRSQERAHRALHDLQLALARAEKCAPASAAAGPADNSIAALAQQARSTTTSEALLARNPDALEKTMDLVFKLESAAAPCEAPGREDKALVLLSEQRGTPR